MSQLGQLFTLVESPERSGSERTDDDLMRLARGGVRDAFDELVRRHQRRLLRAARQYTGQTALAQDIVQSTFLEVHRSLHRYEPRGNLPAYFHRILVNQFRMARRQLRRQEREPAEPVLAAEPQLPSDVVLANERRRELHAALSKLSEKLRLVVVLRFGADLSYDEIAQALDLPLGTVKRRLFDGLDALRKLVPTP